MPVTFVTHRDQGYVEAWYVGTVSDDELVTAWEAYFRSPEWTPGLHELVDAAQIDSSLITSTGLRRLATLSARTYRQHGVALVIIPRYCARVVKRTWPAGVQSRRG